MLRFGLKYWLVLLFGVNAYLSKAQETVYPALPLEGATVVDFVPGGWRLLGEVSYGDLNKDGEADAAFVIESKDTMSELLYEAETKKNSWEERSKPRILVILWKDKSAAHYRLALQNNQFILREDEGGVQGDPLQAVEIRNGALALRFMGGSRERWSIGYVFRWQNNDWFLIGAEHSIYDDLTSESEARSYNFSTGKMEYVKEQTLGDKPSRKTSWKKIPSQPLKTFKTLIRPMTWEIEKGIYL